MSYFIMSDGITVGSGHQSDLYELLKLSQVDGAIVSQ